MGALICRAGHSAQGFPFIPVIIEHFAADTAGQLCPVESVYMAFQRILVFCNTTLQLQLGANESGVLGFTQGIVGRAAGRDLKDLHSGL